MAGKQVYMVTDKVTKEVKDMVGEYNEWLRDKVVQSKFFFYPRLLSSRIFLALRVFLEITNKCDQCDYEYSHLCLLRTH